VLVAGSVVSEFATSVGLLAGLIAVGGFIAHAGPVLLEHGEERIRQATVVGGLVGLSVGAFVMVLSAYPW
jgi:hypothetical protein